MGLSTGRSRSDLCPTRYRLDGIGFWKNSLAADRVGWIRLQRVLGWVGWRQRSKKMARKLREKVRKTQIWRKSHWNLWDFARFGLNLTRFDEISLDSIKISLDLYEIAPESRFFIAEIWVFIAEIWVFARLWVFHRLVRVFGFLGERNRNWPTGVSFWWRKSTTNRRSRSGQPFQISSDWVSGWVGSPDMFGQPY